MYLVPYKRYFSCTGHTDLPLSYILYERGTDLSKKSPLLIHHSLIGRSAEGKGGGREWKGGGWGGGREWKGGGKGLKILISMDRDSLLYFRNSNQDLKIAL
jgi:hypothetical protein